MLQSKMSSICYKSVIYAKHLWLMSTGEDCPTKHGCHINMLPTLPYISQTSTIWNTIKFCMICSHVINWHISKHHSSPSRWHKLIAIYIPLPTLPLPTLLCWCNLNRKRLCSLVPHQKRIEQFLLAVSYIILVDSPWIMMQSHGSSWFRHLQWFVSVLG